MRLLLYSALEKQNLSELFIKTKGIELIDFLEARVTELKKKGTVRSLDTTLAARAFLGMVIHYSLAQEIYGLKRYFKRSNRSVAEVFVDIFFEGVRRR